MRGFDEALADLAAALDQDMPAVAVEAAWVVADEARTSHSYQTRTGLLESRTVVGRVRGRFLAGSLEVQVLGDTPYGAYVEDGTSRSQAFQFLGTAWVIREEDFTRAIESGMGEAAQRAGW